MKQPAARAFVANPRRRYVVSSAHPRMVNGKPSKNPRYLQKRPDLVNPRDTYLAEIARAARAARFPPDSPSTFPVNAVLAGRRNNPPDPKTGLPPLAVYSPIHYQELPELFMDFICSLTGKSPSTTGFGSEGALTKGPFNALWPVVDLNNALVSCDPHRLRGLHHVGRIHGPELPRGSRHQHAGAGDLVPHARAGARSEIPDRPTATWRGARFLPGRPHGAGQPPGLSHHVALRRSLPGPDFRDAGCGIHRGDAAPRKAGHRRMFAAGVDSIVEAQTRVAKQYFEDGSVEAACPPLKALLHIMACGKYQGKTMRRSGACARMFTREALLASDWYAERLRAQADARRRAVEASRGRAGEGRVHAGSGCGVPPGGSEESNWRGQRGGVSERTGRHDRRRPVPRAVTKCSDGIINQFLTHCGADPPVRGTPWSRCGRLAVVRRRPTRASAADQGVCPTNLTQ